MKQLSPLVLVAVLVMTGGVARADDKSHKAAAEQLLKVVDAEKMLEQSINVAVEQQLKANPQLVPAKEAMQKFFKKHLSYAALKDDMIKIYVEEFTEDELRKVAEFYSTPLGKKVITKVPALLQKGSDIGTKRIQDNVDELRQLVEEELRKK